MDDYLVRDILSEVHSAVNKAVAKHPTPMRSSHEGYAVLLEEVDELWEEVKKQNDARSNDALRKEALHVAAMAVRFIYDVLDQEE